ncbi:hypothetical protein KSP39_PZI020276 [Platanthera zijinensis]|uniref:Uncharacterized protein n=1 Tax=Platanthera zijinensis TaxID=2320716 RepID=A0AAP0FWW0_9ASPA
MSWSHVANMTDIRKSLFHVMQLLLPHSKQYLSPQFSLPKDRTGGYPGRQSYCSQLVLGRPGLSIRAVCANKGGGQLGRLMLSQQVVPRRPAWQMPWSSSGGAVSGSRGVHRLERTGDGVRRDWRTGASVGSVRGDRVVKRGLLLSPPSSAAVVLCFGCELGECGLELCPQGVRTEAGFARLCRLLSLSAKFGSWLMFLSYKLGGADWSSVHCSPARYSPSCPIESPVSTLASLSSKNTEVLLITFPSPAHDLASAQAYSNHGYNIANIASTLVQQQRKKKVEVLCAKLRKAQSPVADRNSE